MSEQKFSFSGSFQKAKEYIDTQIELVRLKAIAKSARIVGALVVDIGKLLLGLIIVFFFSLALGFYLGELLGSYALGFLVTGGIFLIFLLLVRVFSSTLESKFMDLTIRKVVSMWKDDEDVENESVPPGTIENEDIDDKESDERKNS
ncbi:phage holin family protein [Sphingobacterium sp. SGG-5]|uniref:phage holin family protein n=1 Tax=Sphingobacterium sp. SGG-5 TaxID=2710881 RepID=UPI0019D20613|nr:phage holin family protein [Sphingobacterium sp. SGG-5]